MKSITLEEMKDQLDFFQKMYDAVRLIDPINKRVLDYRASAFHETLEVCYQYWGNEKICDNCISVRSYREDKSFVKLEKLSENIILITAIPITNAGFPSVLELLKNVTDNMLIGSGDYNQGKVLTQFVEELNDAIVKDPLTSLYNRRFVEERLPIDLVKASLTRTTVSVCFIDVDEFKTINDRFGHGAGDKAIQMIGEVIKKSIDSFDAWAARYGGDEFIICLNGMTEKEADQMIRTIKNEISAIRMNDDLPDSCLSVSYGVETMDKVMMTAEELIDRADVKMYRAKEKNKSPE